MNVCMVSPPIANYPCIIAFRRDNSNVDTCPDPSSFPTKGLVPREGSGSETMYVTVGLSTSPQSNSPFSSKSSVILSFFNEVYFGTPLSSLLGDRDTFRHREFSFTLEDDVYVRYQSFDSQESLEEGIRKAMPYKMDIGAIFSVRVSMTQIKWG